MENRQQLYARRVSQELDKMIMSWDNILEEWYPIAIKALDFANVRLLQIPQSKFIDLYKTEKQGLNMNVVRVLCNNMEDRSANEMGIPGEMWAGILQQNVEVAKRFRELVIPIQKKIEKEFEIMAGGASSIKMFKAEA